MPKTEDILEMILEGKVLDVLIDRFTSIIKPALEQLFKSLTDSFEAEIKAELLLSLSEASVELIDERYGHMDQCMKSVTEENAMLKKQLNFLEILRL